MRGEFVDIDDTGARVEVTAEGIEHERTGKATLSFTRPFSLDEGAWRRLVEEVDAMIERSKS
jgi:hypothetical protein